MTISPPENVTSARSHLTSLADTLPDDTVLPVARHGKPVLAIMKWADFEKNIQKKERKSLAGIWAGKGYEFTDEDFAEVRKEWNRSL